MTLEQQFQAYFQALDKSGDEDRCFLCRRTPAEVKGFFGFHEDGTPIEPERYGIEDVVLDPELDIMSYRGTRPVCSVCQLNLESILLSPEGPAALRKLLAEMEHDRDRLWSRQGIESEPPHRE